MVDEDERMKQLYPVNNPYGVSKEEQWFHTEMMIKNDDDKVIDNIATLGGVQKAWWGRLFPG